MAELKGGPRCQARPDESISHPQCEEQCDRERDEEEDGERERERRRGTHKALC